MQALFKIHSSTSVTFTPFSMRLFSDIVYMVNALTIIFSYRFQSIGGHSLNGKYITVAEFAEKAGVSKQTIYDQMQDGKKLAPYRKRINGKKMLRVDALSYYTVKAAEFAAEDQEPEQAPEPDNPVVSMLMDQIRVKDEQIAAQFEELKARAAELAAKDQQIKDLTETVKGQLTLQYRLQDQITMLTAGTAPEGPAAEPEQAPEPQPETGAAADQSQKPEAAAEQPAAAEPQPAAEDPVKGGFIGWFRRLMGGR